MGCSTGQLGRTAGVKASEEAGGGFVSGRRGCAMRELRKLRALDDVREVQSRCVLRAHVSGRSLQRAQGSMPSYLGGKGVVAADIGQRCFHLWRETSIDPQVSSIKLTV
jgi:hypothetical protein